MANENEVKWTKGQKVYRAEFTSTVGVREFTVVAVGQCIWMIRDRTGSKSGGSPGWMRHLYQTSPEAAVQALRDRMRQNVLDSRADLETAETKLLAAFGKEAMP